MLSDQFILTLFFSIAFIFVYINVLFRKSALLRFRRWRSLFPIAFLLNIVCFATIAWYFNSKYGFITDDVNYFAGALSYTKGYFDIQTGNEFMYFLSRPFRLYLDFDRASFHALWGALGFIGSLNFLYVLSKRIDFSLLSEKRDQMIYFYSLLCFPNFMAWGRFYGKDSLSLFLISVYFLGAYQLLTGAKFRLQAIFLAVIPVMLLYKVRAHIATVSTMGLLVGLYLKSISFKSQYSAILFKLFIPGLIAVVCVVGAGFSLKKITHKETVTIDVVEQTLTDATLMGASGGSAVKSIDNVNEDPNVVFSTKTLASNIFLLLFAPMPWQVRGVADALAFLSNILLFIFIIRYAKKVDLSDIFQKYLFVMAGLLIVLLSFMTGNVGLILRQKIIILPFLFLFLFSAKLSLQKYSLHPTIKSQCR